MWLTDRRAVAERAVTPHPEPRPNGVPSSRLACAESTIIGPLARTNHPRTLADCPTIGRLPCLRLAHGPPIKGGHPNPARRRAAPMGVPPSGAKRHVIRTPRRGIRLTRVRSTVTGDIDLNGILGLNPQVRNGYQRITVRFAVKGDAPRRNYRTRRAVPRSLRGVRRDHQRGAGRHRGRHQLNGAGARYVADLSVVEPS